MMKQRVHTLPALARRQARQNIYGVRWVHSTPSKNALAATATEQFTHDDSHESRQLQQTPKKPSRQSTPPLSILPLSTVLRTYAITTMSSSPLLLNTTITLLLRMLSAKNLIFDPDRNPVLRWLVRRTFYDQFCVGENKAEVQQNVAKIKALGYEGMIFESALEVLAAEAELPAEDSARTKVEIENWKKAMLQTVEMANEGDMIGLKWSGLGALALHNLQHNLPPTPLMQSAIDSLATFAAEKGVILLPSAEEEHTNIGIDAWTLALQKKYNNVPEKPRVYTTYQTYLKSTPAKLAAHLEEARKHGYTAGVKLVRGAYLHSEPRERIWETIEKTHECYDGLAEACLKKEWNSVLKPVNGDTNTPFPDIGVVIATHNAVSVQRAMRIRDAQAAAHQPRPQLAYAQLLGMADEVSTKIILDRRQKEMEGAKGLLNVDAPRAFKCVCWGTTGQCLNYLLRRASENRDAVQRTGETRKAMGEEVVRRVKGFIGLA